MGKFLRSSVVVLVKVLLLFMMLVSMSSCFVFRF